jgi:SP family facilitated glucose transporter-like MFS transporter 1
LVNIVLFQSQRFLFLAFTVVPCIFQLGTLTFCPESPKYNFITKGKTEQAEKDLKKLRGRDDVGAELDIVKDEALAARNQPKVKFFDMFKGALKWPLFIAIMSVKKTRLQSLISTF